MTSENDGPSRPTKSPNAFRTISEVARELGLPQHVLRFWESKFSQVSPMKRAGGRRYYRPDDIALLDQIRNLLHDEGYTIKGVQKLLRQNGGKTPSKEKMDTVANTTETPAPTAPDNSELMDTIRASVADLEGVHSTLRDALKPA
jgi:DNA-binding transcriptional MerR regulator